MGTTIPELSSAGTLDGTEPLETVQGGVSVKTTAQAVANLTPSVTGGNPTATAGPNAINGSATSFMRSDGAPAIQKGTSSQFGIVQVDGTTITSASGVITAVGGGGGPSAGNPTATAGPAAINGVATTYMRSDAAPAIQKASSSQFGIVEVDGTTITSASGVISAVTQALTVSTQSGTTYTAVLGDANTWINFNNGSAISFTIPPHASVAFPIGTSITGSQDGAGVVGIVAGGGVTIKSAGSLLHTNGQNAVFELTQVATDVWKLYGNLVT